MSDRISFRPRGATVPITVSASSSAETLIAAQQVTQSVRVMNDGTATVWVKFGPSGMGAATTTADMPVASGACEVFTTRDAYVRVIAAGSTGIIYFTPGDGI